MSVSSYQLSQQLRRQGAQAEERFIAATIVAYEDAIDALGDEIEALTTRIAQLDEPSLNQMMALERFRSLQDQLTDEYERIVRAGTFPQIEALAAEAIVIGRDGADAQFASYGIEGYASLGNAEMLALLEDVIADGNIGKAVNAIPAGARDDVLRSLMSALVLGQGPAATARALQQQLKDRSRADIETLARTTQMGAQRKASIEHYNRNSDMLDGWVWQASLGSAPIPCFPAGTIVTTSHGGKAIENIVSGDWVLTHKGRYRRVQATSKRLYTGLMVEVKTSTGHVACTPEHPFLVVRGSDLEWTDASKLRSGDRVVRDERPNILDYPVRHAVIQPIVADSDNTQSPCNQPLSLAIVTALDRRFRVPVGAVDLKNSVVTGQKEIDRIAPVGKLMFLNSVYAKIFKTLPHDALRRRFARKASVTCNRTKAMRRNGGDLTERLSARWAVNHDRRVSAFWRAINLVGLALAKHLLTAWTFKVNAVVTPAFVAAILGSARYGITQNVRSTSLTGGDMQYPGGYLPWGYQWTCRQSAFMRAVLSIGVLIQHAELNTAKLAGSEAFRTTFSKRGYAMGLDLLVRRIAWSRAKFPAAFAYPSSRDIKGSSALQAGAILGAHRMVLPFGAKSPAVSAARGRLDSSILPSVSQEQPQIASGKDDLPSRFSVQPVSSVSSRHVGIYQYVYNLQVDEDESYIANGFVVHNCLACLAQHGTVHPLDEQMVSHPRCRCTASPLPKRTRVEVMTGDAWFKSLSATDQRRILGPARYELWEAGRFEMADLISYSSGKYGESMSVTPAKHL